MNLLIDWPHVCYMRYCSSNLETSVRLTKALESYGVLEVDGRPWSHAACRYSARGLLSRTVPRSMCTAYITKARARLNVEYAQHLRTYACRNTLSSKERQIFRACGERKVPRFVLDLVILTFRQELGALSQRS